MPIIQLTKYTQNLLHYSKHSEHEDIQLPSYNMLKAFRLVKMSKLISTAHISHIY